MLLNNRSRTNALVAVVVGVFLPMIGLASENICYESDAHEKDQDKHVNIVYVDGSADSSGDGVSWGTAFNSLRNALIFANANEELDELWVAKGTYTADVEDGGPFDIQGNIIIRGGFRGTETKRFESDSEENKTVFTKVGAVKHIIFIDNLSKVEITGVSIVGGDASGELFRDEAGVRNEVRGGAVLAYDSTLKFCDVTFERNQAKKFGGAIYLEKGRLVIRNVEFIGNAVLRGEYKVHDQLEDADTDGGAIAVHDGDLDISNALFKDNIAGDDGGGISVRRTNVKITESKFFGNKGIGVVVPMFLPVFTDDFGGSFGGALSIQNEYVGQNAGDQSRTVLIRDSTFSNNKSSIGSAGFIYNSPGSSTIIENSVFSSNGGDGFVDAEAPPNEQGVAFGRGAAAFLILGGRAGDKERGVDGEYLRGLHNVDIEKSIFRNNEASYGGSLVLHSVVANVRDSEFENNTARQRGGAIFSQNLFSLFDQFLWLEPDLGVVNVIDSLFVGNKVLGQLETMQREIFPHVITDVEQAFGGGAIENDTSGVMNVVNSIFIDNVAINSDGGAIHNASTPVSSFGQGTTPALPIFYPGKLTVKGSTFINNRVTGSGSGGAIANGGNAVNGSVFDANGVDRRGDVNGAVAEIEDSRFLKGNAADFGGAMVNWSGSRLSVSGSQFFGNAASDGAAVASVGHESNKATLTIHDSCSSKNVGINGIGILTIATNSDIDLNNHCDKEEEMD